MVQLNEVEPRPAYRGYTLDTPPLVAIAAFVERYGQEPAEPPFVSGTALLVGPIPIPANGGTMP